MLELSIPINLGSDRPNKESDTIVAFSKFLGLLFGQVQLFSYPYLKMQLKLVLIFIILSVIVSFQIDF